jgi:transcription antitermination protein NusB
MSLPKQKFREGVLQLLFSLEFFETEKDELLDLLKQQIKTTQKEAILIYEYAQKIKEKLKPIDDEVKKTSISYDFDRISKVELNIIRLSAYEIFFDEKIPGRVSIAEAIRLCRKFSTPQGASFVNAILDTIYKKNGPEKKASV